MEKTVLVLLPLDGVQRTKLTAVAPQRRFLFSSADTVTAEQAQSAEIIIGNIPLSLLKHCTMLKWYQLQSAGADKVLGSLAADVLLTNASGAYDKAQAEFILGALLALMKRLPAYWKNQQQRIWQDEGFERMLFGSTAVLVGMGQIGGALADMLNALGAYTIGVTRTGRSNVYVSDELHAVDRLDEQLIRADAVILTLPATAETTGMFDARRFSCTRRGALFLNMGRGNTVDTQALCDALENGILSGAAIDVTEEEPLPAASKLWALPNVILTPHIAGHDFLPFVLEKTLHIAMKNLARYERGEPLENVVDRSLGYRRKDFAPDLS
ncbi:MAG: D-2-hydroxyacid dehydrogenase [Clostridiaceae bacterium]|nr:D-2-hydroxyacid dehydrogenase [Eubacteriales bacterium]